MRVVSNTSPLSNLAIIGRLDLLERRYGLIQILPAVARELARLSHQAAKTALNAALAKGWISIEAPVQPSTRAALPLPLDLGEAEAIALAVQSNADLLLIDEKRGREAARQSGLAVGGVLGELLHAKIAGWIPSLRIEIEQLRTQAGFFVDSKIERFVLSQAGE